MTATLPQAAPSASVIDEIAAERRRQVEAEGWTPEHDDAHGVGELATAAGLYALNAGHVGVPLKDKTAGVPNAWPWHRHWWKPKDRRRDLIRAGALIIAEIERLDRAALAKAEGRP